MVAAGLAPGTWLRSALPPPDNSQQLTIRKLDAPRLRLDGAKGAERATDAPVLNAAWQLTSPNSEFGSYSALLLLPCHECPTPSASPAAVTPAVADTQRPRNGIFARPSAALCREKCHASPFTAWPARSWCSSLRRSLVSSRRSPSHAVAVPGSGPRKTSSPCRLKSRASSRALREMS